MNAPVANAGPKPPARPAGNGRGRVSAFSWVPLMNLPTREPMPSRSVIRGWRALLIDRLP
jgi:hypothetical protein